MSQSEANEQVPLITRVRRERGLTLEQVAECVGTGKGNLRRVENGEQVPKRDLARALFEFYGGTVPLGAIYDSAFEPAAADIRSARDRRVLELYKAHRTISEIVEAVGISRRHVNRIIARAR